MPVAIPSGEVLGGLFFGHAEPDRFGQEHEKIAEGLAGHAATAIENARLFRAVEIELNQRRRAESALRANEARLAFLDDLARASAHASGAREVLDITTRMLGESLGAQSCTYADVEPDGDLFTVRGQWRAEGAEPLLGEYRLSAFGAHLTSHLREGRPLVVRDVAFRRATAD